MKSLVSKIKAGPWTKLSNKYGDRPWWRLETALALLAIAGGLISGFMSSKNYEAIQENYQNIYATAEVIVAGKDLHAGEVLASSYLKKRKFLKSNVTINMVAHDKARIIVGRRLSMDLKQGDPILLSAVAGLDDNAEIAEKIPPGKRLFNLRVEDLAARRGFVKPNDHVDIIAHIDLPERGLTAFTLLQDVTLVSVGNVVVDEDSDRRGGADVSFFVDAKDLEMLTFAQKKGTFSLSLRNPGDLSRVDSSGGIDLNEFLDADRIHQVSGGGELKVVKKKSEAKKVAR